MIKKFILVFVILFSLNVYAEESPPDNPSADVPLIEAAPDAESILESILGLFPSFRSYIVPAHNAQCPTSSFSAFGRVFTINAHCSLVDNIRAPMNSLMVAVWMVVSVFIILAT